jgi:hypothetical protein
LTHSAAPNPAFESGVRKRRSELALSEVEGVNPEPLGCTRGLEFIERQPQHLCWGVEGLTKERSGKHLATYLFENIEKKGGKNGRRYFESDQNWHPNKWANFYPY